MEEHGIDPLLTARCTDILCQMIESQVQNGDREGVIQICEAMLIAAGHAVLRFSGSEKYFAALHGMAQFAATAKGSEAKH